MQEILKEVIKMTACLDTSGLKVLGTDTATELSAIDKEKDLVVYARPKQVIPDFKGSFSIPNPKLLSSLLAFDQYRSESIKIERFTRPSTNAEGKVEEVEVPKRIVFADKKGGGAVFFFSHAGILGADYPQIGFELDFEPSKEAIKEFAKLSAMFATPDCKFFRASLKDHKLKFSLGTEGATTHHGEMVFEEEVRGAIASNLAWDSNRFNMMLRTIGDRPMRMSISNKGVMRVTTETELANYQFWLRCVKI